MDDDYENAEDVFLQREDSHVSDEDYVNVNMHVEKLELGNNNEGARYTNPRISMRNEMNDEDDYEIPQTIISEKEDSDVIDDDYISVDAGVEKMSVCSDCPENTHKTAHGEMETDSENDYENAEATVHQREDSDESDGLDESDEDYININCETSDHVEFTCDYSYRGTGDIRSTRSNSTHITVETEHREENLKRRLEQLEN
ncbi:hypothetical protein AOLI_G00172480 [Acnodon oligacanthus]